MASKEERVHRPVKKTEYEIRFASRSAEKGWRDLQATQRNALADSWDFLTRTPHERGPLNQPMKAELAHVTYQGEDHERWQHKPVAQGDSRIWYFIVDRIVYLEQVHTKKPNQTK